MPIAKQEFGPTPFGTAYLYTLTNAAGLAVKITNYGAIVVSLMAADRQGQSADVVLGLDSLEQYLDRNPYYGAVCGRYANRIANGRFVLDGVEYRLATNNGPNALHGGKKGFDKVLWQEQAVTSPDGAAVKMSYLSPDGEEGYPGNLATTITYTWTDKNELRLDYHAQTDRPTVVNLTNHSYFNLCGQGVGNILEHEVTLNAGHFTPVSDKLIPTGQIQSVRGTPLDFTSPRRIGERIDQDDQQLKFAGGYDHNFVLDKKAGELSRAATVYELASGRVMEVLTTEPGIQLYTGNFLRQDPGKGGLAYRNRHALCLETQHFPDSPNQPQFPTTVLRPGETYRQTTIYKFSTR